MRFEADQYYPNAIPLESLIPNKPHLWFLDENTRVAVISMATGVRVVLDFCPHMGAPFSDGEVCEERQAIRCPWHGYLFSLETGKFMENPNDAIFGCMKKLYKSYQPEKTPVYSLRFLEAEVSGNHVYVRKPEKRAVKKAEKTEIAQTPEWVAPV